MSFTPLRFQSALAAGGVALMPFVLMQFTFEHQGTLITSADLPATLAPSHVFLTAVMLLGTVFHFGLIVKLLFELTVWLARGDGVKAFMADPSVNIGIFSPVIALGMTINVLLGPVVFFVPQWSQQVPALLAYGIYPFTVLFAFCLYLTVVVARSWLFRNGQEVGFSYNGLLDVFAWGMVALAGSGVTLMATDTGVTAVASGLTLTAISIGLFIYGVKGLYLLLNQLASGKHPPHALKPAHFVIVPINCLFGISIFKIAGYTKAALGIDIDALAFAAVVMLLGLSVFWVVLCAVAFRTWFIEEFPKPDFYPAQWGLVCVLVGLEVLAIYSHASFYPSPLFLGFAYLSILVATAVYAFVFLKFTGIWRPTRIAAG